ncbi:MAG: ABC transporter substrate-binding protein [Acidimicrobiia bacterium]
MTTRRPVRWIAVLCTLMLVLVACASSEDSGDDGDDGGSDEKPATLQSDVGFSGDENGGTITLGILTPQTTAFAALGEQVTNGNKLYWDALNAEGGIAGKYQVELVEADTEYAGEKARSEYQRIKGDVAMFGQVLGTEVTNNLLPLMEDDEYAGAPATLDAEWVTMPNLAPVLAPYQIEIINGAAYYGDTEGFDGKNACVIKQDDSYGDAGQEGADFAATELGFDIKTSASFATGDDMTAQIQQLQDNECDVVFQASTLIDSPSIWGRAEAVGFTPRWIGLGPAWSSSFAEGDLASYIKDNVWIVAEDGASLDESIPGVKQMLDQRDQFAPDTAINLFSLFGYVSAWGTAQILEKAFDNNDVTPAGIVKAINEEQTLTFDGAAGDYEYGPDRSPPRVNAIFTAADSSEDTGLAVVELTVESDAAKNYSF